MNAPADARPVEILLVNDNPGDVNLIKVALRRSAISNRLQVANDGVEALAWLQYESPIVDRALPDVILLDLNLPRKNGHEVLAAIKGDARLQRIPVVVVTSSRSTEDVLLSHDLKADSYLTKPESPAQFPELIRAIMAFWRATPEVLLKATR